MEHSVSKLDLSVLNLEILTIEGVSALLHCSVDTIRRVSPEELPVYRVGKSNLYLREEVIRFLRTKRVWDRRGAPISNSGRSVGIDVDAVIHGVLDSRPVDAREPSRRRAK